MNSMSIVAAVSAVLFASSAVAGLAGAESDDDAARKLEAIRKQRDLPALAAIVVKDGKVCDQAAVGVRKEGDSTPITMDDQFHIGSCTKSMTATLTGMLIDEGKLRWDTTIAEVFPELKGQMDERYDSVTVEQLMRHRGGVPTKPPAAAWKRAWERHGTPTEQRYEFIKAVLSQPPQALPGSRFIYSNQGYAVLGAMLERVTGKSWEAMLSDRVFKPLHMKSAGFGVPGIPGEVKQPWGHIREDDEIKPIQADNPPAIGPAGSVHCSLPDLCRFAMLHLGDRQDSSLVKPETLAKLHTPPEGGDYACGWVCLKRNWSGGTALMHNGSNGMWYLVMWLAPERNFAVIAATNIAGASAERGCDEACAGMIQKWLSP